MIHLVGVQHFGEVVGDIGRAGDVVAGSDLDLLGGDADEQDGFGGHESDQPGIAAMRSGVVMMGCMVAPLGLRVRFATGGLWLETANTNEASDNCFRGARPVTACGEMNFAPWWRGWKPWARKCKANRGQGCSPCGVAASDQVTAQRQSHCRTDEQPARRLDATTPAATPQSGGISMRECKLTCGARRGCRALV